MLLSVCILFMWFQTVKSWTFPAAPRIRINVTEAETNSPSVEATGETLGIAALALSVLALVLILVILLWLALHEASSSTLANLSVANGHHVTHPPSQFRGGPEKVSIETGVYMNYSCNESYTNPDPTSMDSMYSSMS